MGTLTTVSTPQGEGEKKRETWSNKHFQGRGKTLKSNQMNIHEVNLVSVIVKFGCHLSSRHVKILDVSKLYITRELSKNSNFTIQITFTSKGSLRSMVLIFYCLSNFIKVATIRPSLNHAFLN